MVAQAGSAAAADQLNPARTARGRAKPTHHCFLLNYLVCAPHSPANYRPVDPGVVVETAKKVSQVCGVPVAMQMLATLTADLGRA